jgi:hypothetical protein
MLCMQYKTYVEQTKRNLQVLLPPVHRDVIVSPINSLILPVLQLLDYYLYPIYWTKGYDSVKTSHIRTVSNA